MRGRGYAQLSRDSQHQGAARPSGLGGPRRARAAANAGWVCALVVALGGIYGGSWLTMWGNLYYRELWHIAFQSHGKAHEYLSFWYLWDNLGRIVWPEALHRAVDHNYNGRYEKDLSTFVPGLLVIGASIALLVVSGARLAPLRDAACRRLQRPCRLGPFRAVTVGEALVNAGLLLTLCYWVTPIQRCRGEHGYRCRGPGAEHSEMKGTTYNCTCTRWPAPLGFDHPGVDSLRAFGYWLGSVSGWCLTFALAPVPKHSPLLHLLGLSFEKGVRIHRLMGRAAVLFAVLHTAFVVVDWETRPVALKMWAQGYWFRYSLLQLTPWCTVGAAAHQHGGYRWPWDDDTGEWLEGITPGVGAMSGWGVQGSMTWLNLTGSCPWLFDTVHFEHQYGCRDGTRCSGSGSPSCCADHGGRILCPPTSPNMCNDTGCVDEDFLALAKNPRWVDLSGGEHCCASDDCSDQGGLRPCVVQVGGRRVVVPAPLRYGGLARSSGCARPEHPNLLWKMGLTGSAWGVENFTGMVATVMFVLLWLGSLERVRRRCFEGFYKAHIVCSVIAFFGLLFHFSCKPQESLSVFVIFQPVSAISLRTDGGLDDASVVLLVMLFDYLWRWWIIRSSDAVVEEVDVLRMDRSAGGGGDIIKLVLSHPTLRITEPGQYCFLRIGQLGWLQWHPFSVASSPAFSEQNDGRFTLLIRDLGSWTKELVESGPSLLAKSAKVSCDGMYGHITVPLCMYRAVVITCGGIGCTPMFSALMHLAEQPAEQRPFVCFVWSVREPELVRCFGSELTKASQLGWDVRVHLTTTSTSPAAASEEGETAPLRRGDDARDADEESSLMLSCGYGGVLHGRPKLPRILGAVEKRLAAARIHRCAVLTCGPSGLVGDTKAACADTSGAVAFELHSEEFEW